MQTLLNTFGNNNLFVDRFMDYHVARLKREIKRMQATLNKYEKKYDIKSDKFHQKLENGELGDDRDFVMWSGIYELMLDSQNKLDKIS